MTSPAATSRATTQAPRRRDVSVYSLRGLALLLMVAGHVIGWDAHSGMRVAEDSGWRLAYLLLEDVRMPLFTVLSGYVYAMRPLRDPAFTGRFVRGKARRLLLPLLTVGTAFYLLQYLTPGTNATPPVTDVWHVWLAGYAHFWFAQSVFIVFVLVVLAERAALLATVPGWVAVTGVAAPATASVPLWSTQPWVPAWLVGFVWLLPYFLLGLGLRRFPGLARHRLAVGAFAVLGAGLLTVKALSPGEWPPLADASAALVGALPVLVGIVRAKGALSWRPLAWLGQFSYGVYLLHVFGAAGMRLVLDRLGITAEPVTFLAALAAGIALPVFLELALATHRWPMLLTFGQKPAPRASYGEVWHEGRGPSR